MDYKKAQAITREKLKPKDISYQYPDSRPQHYVMIGSTPTLVNRKRSRLANKDRTKTKHNAKHTIGEGWERPDSLEYDPNLSNRQKNNIRKSQRERK
jgi:hypothetical protein